MTSIFLCVSSASCFTSDCVEAVHMAGSVLSDPLYPSVLPSSSCLFKSRAGGRVPEGISLSNMKSALLWVLKPESQL